MRKLTLALLLLVASPTFSYAWGYKGHAVEGKTLREAATALSVTAKGLVRPPEVPDFTKGR